eukprot:GEMP01016621.1.p1 GENE.GEMP01016621.1~~GEMP01016621.1.p1  ORF type:complete len:304 (+),score=18.10 GEMP01016621.1:322-1233(+)
MLCWAILYLCLQARIPIKDQERIGTETTPKVPVKGEEGVTQPGWFSQLFESVRRLFDEEKAVDDKTVQEFIRSVCKTNKESDFLRLRTALNGFTSENAHTSAKAFLRMLKEHPKDDSIANIVAEQSCQIIAKVVSEATGDGASKEPGYAASRRPDECMDKMKVCFKDMSSNEKKDVVECFGEKWQGPVVEKLIDTGIAFINGPSDDNISDVIDGVMSAWKPMGGEKGTFEKNTVEKLKEFNVIAQYIIKTINKLSESPGAPDTVKVKGELEALKSLMSVPIVISDIAESCQKKNITSIPHTTD